MATPGTMRKPMQQSMVQNASSLVSTTSGSATNRSSGEGTKTDSRSSRCRTTSSYESSVGASSYKGAPFGLDKLNHPLLDMLEDFVVKVGKPKQRNSSAKVRSTRENELLSPDNSNDDEDEVGDDASRQSNDDEEDGDTSPQSNDDDGFRTSSPEVGDDEWFNRKGLHPRVRTSSSSSFENAKGINSRQTPSLWGLGSLQAIRKLLEFRDEQPEIDKYAVKDYEGEELDSFLSAMDVPQSTAGTPSPLKAKWTMLPNKNRKKRLSIADDANMHDSSDSKTNSLHESDESAPIDETQTTENRPQSSDSGPFGPPPLRTNSTEEFEIVFGEADTPGSAGPLWGNPRLWEEWRVDEGTEEAGPVPPETPVSIALSDDSGVIDAKEEVQESTGHSVQARTVDFEERVGLEDGVGQLALTVDLIEPPCKSSGYRYPWEFKRPPIAPRITEPRKRLSVSADRDIEVVFSSTPCSPEEDEREEEDVLRLHPRRFFESNNSTHTVSLNKCASIDQTVNISGASPRVDATPDTVTGKGPQQLLSSNVRQPYPLPLLLVKDSKNQDSRRKVEPGKTSKTVNVQVIQGPATSNGTDEGDVRDPPTFVSLTSSDTDNETQPVSTVKSSLQDGRKRYIEGKNIPELSLFDAITESSDPNQKGSNSSDTSDAHLETKPGSEVKKTMKKVTVKSPSIKSMMSFQGCPILLRTPRNRRYKKVSDESKTPLELAPSPVLVTDTPAIAAEKSSRNGTPHPWTRKTTRISGTPHPSILKPRITAGTPHPSIAQPRVISETVQRSIVKPRKTTRLSGTPHPSILKPRITAGTPHPSIAQPRVISETVQRSIVKPRINRFRDFLRPVSENDETRAVSRLARQNVGITGSKSPFVKQPPSNVTIPETNGSQKLSSAQFRNEGKSTETRRSRILGDGSSNESSRASSASSLQLTTRCSIRHVAPDRTSEVEEAFEVEESIEIALAPFPLSTTRNIVLRSLTSESPDIVQRSGENVENENIVSVGKKSSLRLNQKVLKRVGRARFAKSRQDSSTHTRDMTITSADAIPGEAIPSVDAERSQLGCSELFGNDLGPNAKTDSSPIGIPNKHCKSPIKRIIKRAHGGKIPEPPEDRPAGRYTLSPRSTSDSAEADNVSVSSIPLGTKQRVLMNMTSASTDRTAVAGDLRTFDMLKEIQISYKKVQADSGVTDSKIAKMKQACRRAKQRRLQNTVSAYYDQHKSTFEDLSLFDVEMEGNKKEVFSPSELSMSSSLTSAETMVTKRLARDMKLLAKIRERRSRGNDAPTNSSGHV